MKKKSSSLAQEGNIFHSGYHLEARDSRVLRGVSKKVPGNNQREIRRVDKRPLYKSAKLSKLLEEAFCSRNCRKFLVTERPYNKTTFRRGGLGLSRRGAGTTLMGDGGSAKP